MPMEFTLLTPETDENSHFPYLICILDVNSFSSCRSCHSWSLDHHRIIPAWLVYYTIDIVYYARIYIYIVIDNKYLCLYIFIYIIIKG